MRLTCWKQWNAETKATKMAQSPWEAQRPHIKELRFTFLIRRAPCTFLWILKNPLKLHKEDVFSPVFAPSCQKQDFVGFSSSREDCSSERGQQTSGWGCSCKSDWRLCALCVTTQGQMSGISCRWRCFLEFEKVPDTLIALNKRKREFFLLSHF